MRAFSPKRISAKQHINKQYLILVSLLIINRKMKRPIFIIFDLLCNGSTALVKHAFKERLKQLREGKFVVNLGGDVNLEQVIDGKLGENNNVCER